ncbi:MULTISPECIES: hypothetical protein [Corallococcus]|uniref:hypothetical protein n=1 Tax=Corallococcus TaxID=83461 RepID=UPI0011C411D8|nr:MULTISPECIES: hypothetical protein [Corallococcus]
MTLRVPPALSILDSEKLGAVDTPENLYKRLKGGLVKDLCAQAETTLGDAGCYDLGLPPPGTSLSLSPGASLDPFSRFAKCHAIECLLDSTTRFSQTLGLFADAIVIPDPFTPLFRNAKLSPGLAIELFRRLRVLEVVRPLVEEGIVKFSSPGMSYCHKCASKVESRIEEAALQSAQETVDRAQFDVRVADRRLCMLSFEAPDADDGLVRMLRLQGDDRGLVDGYRLAPGRPLARSAVRRLRPLLARIYAGELFDALVHLQRAETDGTYFATGARHDARLLHELGRVVAADPVAEQFNALSDVQIPWVSNLTPEQVVVLRAEAYSALPRFRAYVTKALSSGSRLDAVVEIESLQEAAVEAELELSAVSKLKIGKDLITAGGIGLAVVGAALGGEVAVTAIGALVAAVSAVHSRHGPAAQQIQRIKSDPSFVLVRAKRIFEDSHR